MIGLLTSGGQTGVDVAALRTARTLGIPTAGWAPRGFLTEDGPAPWLADYGLVEHTGGYAARTRANAVAADAVLVLVDTPGDVTGGTALTVRLCLQSRPPVPYCLAVMTDPPAEELARLFLAERFPDGGTLMVAGPRESKAPGIGTRAGAWLARVLGAGK